MFRIIAFALLFVLAGCARANPEPPAGIVPENTSAETVPSLYEQTKAAFERLEREAEADDGGGMLREAMELLHRLITQEESLAYTTEHFNSISEGLQVLEAGEARIFAYLGSPAVFGESGDAGYAFLQVHTGDGPRAHVIFEAEARQVWDVRQSDGGAAVLYGVETGHPRRAFAARIAWDGGKIRIEPAIAPHDDGRWRIAPGFDVIARTDGMLVETYIAAMDEERMVVGSSDGQQLILTRNGRSMMYEVSSELRTSG